MDGAVELSEEEIAQLHADYYAEMWQQRAAGRSSLCQRPHELDGDGHEWSLQRQRKQGGPDDFSSLDPA